MRFSLKTLMAATTVTAVLCAVFFALPGWLALAIMGFFGAFAPPAVLAAIVYGRGYGRAFAIGCIAAGGCVPLLYMYASLLAVGILGDWSATSISFDDETALAARVTFGVFFIFIGLSGLTSMGVRWLSIKMAEPETIAAAPQYSILQRRIATVEAAIENDGLQYQAPEEA